MKKKISGYQVFTVFNYLFMFFVLIITAYPIYYVVVASFSDPGALSRNEGLLWAPLKPFTLSAYEMVFDNRLIVSGFTNTLIILVVGLAFNLVLTALGGFFLALDGPMLKNMITVVIIFTMYFSGGLIPGFLNIKGLGLLNTRWALILPGALSTYNMIIMKTAFQSIPKSLIESARLDGASFFQVLVRVMVPLSKATFAVLVLYYGVAHWNSWFGASIYLRDSALYPLQLVMRNILNALNSNAQMEGIGADEMAQAAELMKYALIVVGTAPVLTIYPFIQKYFVKGVMIGAIKG